MNGPEFFALAPNPGQLHQASEWLGMTAMGQIEKKLATSKCFLLFPQQRTLIGDAGRSVSSLRHDLLRRRAMIGRRKSNNLTSSSHSHLVRTASPVRADMIFGKDRG